MVLTREQEEAVKIVLNKYRNHEKFATIAGWAGTGKSVTVRFITEALINSYGLKEEEIGYACFCGKAVQVLIDRGNKNAMTLHKLLFKAIQLPTGEFIFQPKPLGSLEFKVIIVDETSMVDQNFIDILLQHPVFVIFCGDLGQLGPVTKSAENHILDHPDAFLDTIMRQALESDIIRLSMKIRNDESIDNFKGKDAMVLSKSALNTGMLLWADQVLCATNATRISINSQIRQLKGFTKVVEDQEKLVCLRNEWSTVSNNENALTNGCVGTLSNPFETFQRYPQYIGAPNNRVDTINGVFVTNTGDDFGNLNIDRKCILTGEPLLTPQQTYKIRKNKKYQDTVPYEFTYAYAMTTWKFQGSSAPKILGIEEKFPYKKEEHKKFLYTLVTRAEDRCVLIRDI